MTILAALAEINRLAKAWREDEIVALRSHDQSRAHDSRRNAEVLEQLAHDLLRKQAA